MNTVQLYEFSRFDVICKIKMRAKISCYTVFYLQMSLSNLPLAGGMMFITLQ